jgi:hypothetical protein
MTRTALIAAALLATATQAQAVTVTLTAGPSTAVAGANVETFESYAAGSTLNGGTVYAWNSPGATLTGDNIHLISGISAQPKHGAAAVRDQWFSVAGGGDATFAFANAQSYIGFLWGSVDTYNRVTFYNGNSVLGSYVGGTGGLPNVPTGNGHQGAAQYFNFFADSITSVRFQSSGNAFEIDNLASVTAVPEPETYALLLAGLGAMAFVARRRRSDDLR